MLIKVKKKKKQEIREQNPIHLYDFSNSDFSPGSITSNTADTWIKGVSLPTWISSSWVSSLV